eukprot:Clim_evm4s169 gene=Clim_evmTU4s169
MDNHNGPWRFYVKCAESRAVVPIMPGQKVQELLQQALVRTSMEHKGYATLWTDSGFLLSNTDRVIDVLRPQETLVAGKNVYTPPNQCKEDGQLQQIQPSSIASATPAARTALHRFRSDERMQDKLPASIRRENSMLTESTIALVPEAFTADYRIVLVRHCESAGNVDPALFAKTPDHAIPLSARGRDQAVHTGRALNNLLQELFGDTAHCGHIRMWHSPYLRCKETAMRLADECTTWITDLRENPLLAELDYGLFEGTGREVAVDMGREVEKKHYEARANQAGRFWARFPMGESPFDVCQRMQIFFGTIARDWVPTRNKKSRTTPVNTVIIVTHGIALRCFMKMWLHRSVEWYEKEYNPNNGAIRLITREKGDMGYVFNGFDPDSCGGAMQEAVTGTSFAERRAQPDELQIKEGKVEITGDV